MPPLLGIYDRAIEETFMSLVSRCPETKNIEIYLRAMPQEDRVVVIEWGPVGVFVGTMTRPFEGERGRYVSDDHAADPTFWTVFSRVFCYRLWEEAKGESAKAELYEIKEVLHRAKMETRTIQLGIANRLLSVKVLDKNRKPVYSNYVRASFEGDYFDTSRTSSRIREILSHIATKREELDAEARDNSIDLLAAQDYHEWTNRPALPSSMGATKRV